MEGAHDVIVSINEQFLVVSKGHSAATVLGEKHSVANLYKHLADAAIFHWLSGPASNDGAEVELVLGLATSEDDASLSLGEGFSLFDDDAVEQGSESFEREHFYFLGFTFNKLFYATHDFYFPT